MKPTYIAIIVTLAILCSSLAHAQPRIKRAALTSAPQTSISGTHSIQHSIGFTGIKSSKEHTASKVTRGFLLPHNQVSSVPLLLEWSIYPNPFTSHITVDFSAPVSGNLVIQLIDVTGRLVLDKTLKAEQSQKIPMGKLAQGEYFIVASVMGQLFNSKIINFNKTN